MHVPQDTPITNHATTQVAAVATAAASNLGACTHGPSKAITTGDAAGASVAVENGGGVQFALTSRLNATSCGLGEL